MTPEKPLDAKRLDLLISTRRSVFTDQFMPGRRIPDELVWQLLENANWAPTHKHTEPWRFTVFTAAGLSKLASFQVELYRRSARDKFKQEKSDKLFRTIMACSHVIALGMKRSEENPIPEVEEIAAVACAVQNIYLSVTAHGLGGYWSTGGVTYQPEAKAFFGLGEIDRLMGFFYLGYVQLPSGHSKRSPVKEKTTWISQ
jgi:nitroreductase